MKIIQVPNPLLYQSVRQLSLKKINGNDSASVNSAAQVRYEIDKRTTRIIQDMIQAMKLARNPEGVGLAGNQLGLPLAIFVMMPKKNGAVIVCINPKIIEIDKTYHSEKDALSGHSKKKHEKGLEGCLSIPGIWGEVNRAERVRLEYVDENGILHDRWFEGFEAIVIQHEMDHLSGKLFTQRAVEQGHELMKEVGNGEFERYQF
jgi:peptide deformylase